MSKQAVGVVDMWVYKRNDPAKGVKAGDRSPRWGKGSRYRVRWPNPQDGSLDTKWFPDGQVKEARAFASNKTTQLNEGRVISESAGDQFVSDAVREYIESLPNRANSRKRYVTALNNQIKPYWSSKRLRVPTKTAVQTWVTRLEAQGLHPSTVRYVYRLFAASYQRAVDDRKLHFTPCVGITLPELPTTEYWLPEEWQMAALIEAAEPSLKLAYALGAGCGFRRGEILGLTRESFDFVEMTVTASASLWWPTGMGAQLGPLKSKSKGTKRVVPMDEFVANLAREHFDAEYGAVVSIIDTTEPLKRGQSEHVARPRHMVFTNPSTGRVWSGTSIGDRFRKSRGAVEGMSTEFTIHGLRHYYASTLIMAACNPKEVAELLGHASVMKTLTIYAHLWRSSKDKARGIVGAAFARGAADLADRQAKAEAAAKAAQLDADEPGPLAA